MSFREYRKIQRLGHEENDGILLGVCYIQEKVDGANTSIWNEDGVLHCGSRTRDLGDDEFNGFTAYARQHEGIRKLLEQYPQCRLYGEWLVRHTIHYTETNYRKFYLFDIHDDDGYMSPGLVEAMAKEFGIDHVETFSVLENPSLEQINEFVGKTVLGEKGEGVVIKNPGYVNKFGCQAYAKVVTQNFKEDNAIVFGGNNRHSETYWEQYVVNKYITVARVQKNMNKMQPTINHRLDMEETSMIAGVVYHDMITECIWDIQKKVPTLDFKVLKRIASKKAIQIYHDILKESLSIAYKANETEDHNA